MSLSQTKYLMISEKPTPLTLFSDDEIALKGVMAKICREKLATLVKEMDEKSEMASDVIAALLENGRLNISVDTKCDGMDASFFATFSTVKEISKVDASIARWM